MSVFIQRIRHQIKKRQITLANRIILSPQLLRLEFVGEDLADFKSDAPDDHIKLFFADEMRDYTPRSFDNVAKSLVIDFALHEEGVATDWALNAKIGDVLEIGGPKMSAVIEGAPTKWLLIGDETAIPAIARRLEEFCKGTKAIVVISVTGRSEIIKLSTKAEVEFHWIIRNEGQKSDSSKVLLEIKRLNISLFDTFIWIASEASVARDLREFFLTETKHPKHMIKAKGYWVKGIANANEKFD